jgi:hypothetical protein
MGVIQFYAIIPPKKHSKIKKILKKSTKPGFAGEFFPKRDAEGAGGGPRSIAPARDGKAGAGRGGQSEAEPGDSPAPRSPVFKP